MNRSRSSRGVRRSSWAFLTLRGPLWQNFWKKVKNHFSSGSASKKLASKKLGAEKNVWAGFTGFKKICSLEMLYISFPGAQTITWQNCRNRFWYNYIISELQVNNSVFSKFGEFFTFFCFAGTGGSLALPSDLRVSRVSPGATLDLSWAKRMPYPDPVGLRQSQVKN